MNRMLSQFTWGIWGAMALGFGIMSRSWSTGLGLACMGMYFAMGAWASSSFNDPRTLVRRVARVGAALFFGGIALFCIFTVERLYFVNAASYPSWLATRDLGALDEAQIMEFAASSECRGRSEILSKANDQVVIRCGGAMRYEASVYIAHRRGAR